jgi:hypothetical protein
MRNSITHRTPVYWTWISRSEFSYTLNTVSVRPKVAVRVGDRMGFKVSSRDKKPYCHAEYQKGEVVCQVNKQMNTKLCGPEATENGLSTHILYQEDLREGLREIVVRNSTMRFFTIVD